MNLNPETPIQMLNWLIAFVALVFSIVWTIRHKHIWYFGIPIIALLLHQLAFYSYVITLDVLSDTLTFRNSDMAIIWSALLRLHGIITACFALIIAGAVERAIPWIKS
jgi:hypothetical protein